MAEKFDRLLRGLVNFLKASDKLAEKSAEVRGRGELVRRGCEAEYRYSARYLFRYAEARPDNAPVKKEAGEPFVDVFNRGDHFSVIASTHNRDQAGKKFQTSEVKGQKS